MDIEQFKGAFSDLARPNRFQVILSRAGNLQFFCKATTVPGNHVAAADVNYQGRIVKLPGDRENPDWTVTVYSDTTYAVYQAFQAWLKDINDPEGNTGNTPAGVKADGIINHLGRDDAVINSWQIVGCLPTELGSVELDWGTNNTVSSFTVTLANDYVLPN
jgi:hypothetical protein